MKTRLLLCCLLPIFMTACGGGNSTTPGAVVINDNQTLGEGVYVTYILNAGSYKAELTASNNGVIVEWIGGANCPVSSEKKTYSNSCTLTQQGQLKITNPTTFGIGGNEVVSVKATAI